MDFYNQLLAQKLSGGGGGGDKYAAFKALVDDSLTEVTAEMLDGITNIRSYAFYYCTSLSSITIPNSVTSIDKNAFNNCTSLSSVTIPNGVTSIGGSAFSYCTSLTSITIPDSVTSIGGGAFRDCTSLASVTIPNSVTSIGDHVFIDCTSLASVTVKSSIPPSLGTDVFYNTNQSLVIYVPSGSVENYKAASRWATYASRIQAIPSD